MRCTALAAVLGSGPIVAALRMTVVHDTDTPSHPESGIAMGMSIGMATPFGAVCPPPLSFDIDGPP